MIEKVSFASPPGLGCIKGEETQENKKKQKRKKKMELGVKSVKARVESIETVPIIIPSKIS